MRIKIFVDDMFYCSKEIDKDAGNVAKEISNDLTNMTYFSMDLVDGSCLILSGDTLRRAHIIISEKA